MLSVLHSVLSLHLHHQSQRPRTWIKQSNPLSHEAHTNPSTCNFQSSLSSQSLLPSAFKRPSTTKIQSLSPQSSQQHVQSAALLLGYASKYLQPVSCNPLAPRCHPTTLPPLKWLLLSLPCLSRILPRLCTQPCAHPELCALLLSGHNDRISVRGYWLEWIGQPPKPTYTYIPTGNAAKTAAGSTAALFVVAAYAAFAL